MEPPTDPAIRLTAFGNQLIQVHLWLREQLELLRDELESAPTGGRPRDLSLPVVQRIHLPRWSAA